MKCKGHPRGQAARPHGTAQLDANVRKAIADVRQRIDSIGCAFALMVVLQHEHGAFVPFTVGKKQCVVDAGCVRQEGLRTSVLLTARRPQCFLSSL